MIARRLVVVGLVSLCVLAGMLVLGGVAALAAGAPTVSEESFSNVGSTTATVSAQIGAEGSLTTYRVEYGTSNVGESSTPEASVGAPEGPVGVSVQLTGLQPGAEYHFRFAATNAFGGTQGPDMAFTTTASLGPSALVLPDERVYELVSPPENPGELYTPPAASEGGEEDTPGSAPARASIDGNAAVYVGDPAASGGTGSIGKGGGDQFLAVRGAGGWTASDIAPPGSQTLSQEGYQWFSNDLSVGVAGVWDNPPLKPALTTDAPGSNCYVLYAHADGAGSGQNPYSALYTKAQVSGECGDLLFAPLFAGASADSSHFIFQDQPALIAGAEKATGNGEEYCYEHCNLYESVGGLLRVVNVLPDGKADPNAVFGGPSEVRNPPDFSNVISADGSRIFWTDLNTGLLYVRENATRTFQVSAGAARFSAASPNGRYVFYIEGERLWRFDVNRFDKSGKPEPEALDEAREELVGEGAGVQGVIGINETGQDGAYVYFVAAGALAPKAEKRICNAARQEREEKAGTLTPEENERLESEYREEERGQLPVGRGCNIYLLHAGEPVRFVGAITKHDSQLIGPQALGFESHGFGDWQANLGARTAEVTPDGRHLVFESSMSRSLTGYNNFFVTRFSELRAELEVFVFDAGSGSVSCASCTPSGAPPSQARDEIGTFLPITTNSTFMRRWISEDGTRVFFDTDQPLVSQDTNGLQDVYEWEAEGTLGCPVRVPARDDRGCVSLLSGGSSSDLSWLVDASASGGDVFFITRAQLVVADGNEKMDLYDARVGGGFAEVEHSCTGSGCQGVPPAPPIFATPSSVTFSGVGNYEAPQRKATVKPKRRAAKCGKGFVKKRGKCVRKKPKSGKHSKRGAR
jgi:Fibronectin type III domain